jgi:hypothetical protein
VLITGSVELAELLKSAMITRHLPPWNMEKKHAELATQAYVHAAAAKVRPTLKLVAG